MQILQIRKKNKLGIGALASCIYIACMPFGIAKTVGGGSILKYISILVAFLYITEILLYKERYTLTKTKRIVYMLFLLYFITCGFSIFFAVKYENAVTTFKGFILMFGVFFLFTLRTYNENEYDIIIKAWIFSAIFIATITIFYGEESGYMRTTATFLGGTEDKNQLTGYFFLPIAYLVDNIISKNKHRILSYLLILYFVYAILLTGSRGGIVGTTVVFCMYFILSKKNAKFNNKIKNAFIISLILLFIIFILKPLIPEALTERMTLDAIYKDKGSDRLIIWTKLFNLIKDNPYRLITGFGLSGTVKYLHVGFAHNHFIQVLFDTGLISFIIFIFIIIFTINYGKKYRTIELIGLLGMLALSLTITTYAFYKPYWNTLMMVLVSLKITNKNYVNLYRKGKDYNEER